DEAERLFTKTLQLAPESVSARVGLAQIAEIRGHPAVAVDAYEKILALRPQTLVAINNLAYHYAQDGQKLDRAVDLARGGTAVYPKERHIWDTYGWACLRAGRTEDAVPALRKAVSLAPENGTAHYHLGKALLAAGQREEGEKELRAALARTISASDQRDA